MAVVWVVMAAACAGGSGGTTTEQTTANSPLPTIAPPSASGQPTTSVAPTTVPSPSGADAATGEGGDEPGPMSTVRVGAAVAARDDFARYRGLRVGAVVNRASTVDGELLLDVLARSANVELVAAFAPEHGLRAGAPAGASVDDTVDEATGVPVHSLYGSTRAPRPEELAGIDALLFDLQDVGARPYTYISTMGLAMQAAARAGVRFVVLDRPNPIGGDQLGGFVLEPGLRSFVGQYPVPLTHGMTTGELARMIVGEGWLDGLDRLELEVVDLEGWTRSQRWEDTGFDWVPPSPGLPTPEAAAVYPGTVLFEATSLSVGRGTAEPFTVIGAPWADADVVAADLNARALPGVRFEPLTFVPEPNDAVPDPPLAGRRLGGVRVVVTDGQRFRPVDTGIHLLVAFQAEADRVGAGAIVNRADMADLLAGTNRLRRALAARSPAPDIIAGWADEVARFEQLRRPYLRY